MGRSGQTSDLQSYRQKSSDGCTRLGIRVMPSGFTLPSNIGQVLGLDAIAMLSGMFMGTFVEESVPGNPIGALTRGRPLP
jgi:hypothetical protein